MVAPVDGRRSYPDETVCRLTSQDMYPSVYLGIGAHARQTLCNPQRIGRSKKARSRCEALQFQLSGSGGALRNGSRPFFCSEHYTLHFQTQRIGLLRVKQQHGTHQRLNEDYALKQL